MSNTASSWPSWKELHPDTESCYDCTTALMTLLRAAMEQEPGGLAISSAEAPERRGELSSAAPPVLLMESDGPLSSTMSYHLRRHGFTVHVAADGLLGLARWRTEPYGLLVISLTLAGMAGADLCRIIRTTSSVPILTITGSADETDRVAGLDAGADDCLVAPFSEREFIARVRALLRRSEWFLASRRPIRAVGEIELDERGRMLRCAGREVLVTPKEFDLLYCLAQSAGEVVTRLQILERVWGYELVGGTRTLDVHVRWLRQKIERDPAQPKHLITVRGVGYKLVG